MSKWDPVWNCKGGLGIYEALIGCACKLPEQGDNENLKRSIPIKCAILPKLFVTLLIGGPSLTMSIK